MQKERASKKQQELLSFVDGFIKEHGYSPSYREIMHSLDYKSVSTVAVHIEGLIAKGYLARRDNSARSLEVITTRSDQPGSGSASEPDVERLIIARFNETELTDANKKVVKEAFELLGFNQAAQAVVLQGESSENTST